MGATHAGADGIAGDFRILYNTFWNFSNGATSLAIGSPGGNGLNPIATMEIVGNIARRVASLCHVYCKDWYDCDSDVSHQPIRIYGLDGPGRWHAKFRFRNEDAPKGHLVANGQWAINNGEPLYCPRTGMDGNLQPAGATCDVGADEAGGSFACAACRVVQRQAPLRICGSCR